MAAEPAAISKAEAVAAFVDAGVSISDDQLARWRRHGLLPHARQIGLGRGLGSRVELALADVRQAIEISRLFAVREKRVWVGWQLWLRGYPVADCYWRPALTRAHEDIVRVRALSRTVTSEERPRDAESVLHRTLAGTPLAASFARLTPAMVETVIGIVADIITGHFTGFSTDDSESENAAIIALLGASSAERDLPDEKKALFQSNMEARLSDISAGLDRIIKSDRSHEPTVEMRRNFRTVVALAKNLLLLSPAGKSSTFGFGLGIVGRMLARSDVRIEAPMLLFWERLQSASSGLQSAQSIQCRLEESAHMLRLKKLGE